MSGFIERDDWNTFLDEFSKRNQFRSTRLEVFGDSGAQEEEVHLPLVGITFDEKGSEAGSIEVILGGEAANDSRHVTHLVANVERITPLIGATGLEEGLGIEAVDGARTLVRFEQLPQLQA